MMKYNQGNKESQKKAIIPKNMFMEEQINNRNKGITLIALVITILFSYDEKLKCSNSKGFLLQTI